MTRYLISLPTQEDIRQILKFSAEQSGPEGRRRYAANLAAAMKKVAAQPNGPNTRARDELSRSLRSFHICHARGRDPAAIVKDPVHILYYRLVGSGRVEIVRILHDRMEPTRYFNSSSDGV
jgi:toxin ParE1/3/4